MKYKRIGVCPGCHSELIRTDDPVGMLHVWECVQCDMRWEDRYPPASVKA